MTLNTFRKMARAEEVMMRQLMPRTSAASPDPLPGFAQDGVPAKTRWVNGRRLMVKTAGFTFAEVVHG